MLKRNLIVIFYLLYTITIVVGQEPPIQKISIMGATFRGDLPKMGLVFKRDTINEIHKAGFSLLMSMGFPSESVITKRFDHHGNYMVYYEFPKGFALLTVGGIYQNTLACFTDIEYDICPKVINGGKMPEYTFSSGKFRLDDRDLVFYELDNCLGTNLLLVAEVGYEWIIRHLFNSIEIKTSLNTKE